MIRTHRRGFLEWSRGYRLPIASGSPTPRGMMRYDTNKDGWVDKAEWKAGQEARFKELDTDKDGKLSQDELFARTPAAPGNVLPSDRQVERRISRQDNLERRPRSLEIVRKE